MPRRVNAFEALCALAAKERWCWNLWCGTCGHGVFRWGLRALARGQRPSDPTWSVHDGPGAHQSIEELNGPMPSHGNWPMREQRRLQAIVARATVASIAAVAAFPDWLGYVGLALFYTEQAEGRNPRIARALAPQFRQLVQEGSDAADLLDARGESTGRLLTVGDLQVLEFALAPRYRQAPVA